MKPGAALVLATAIASPAAAMTISSPDIRNGAAFAAPQMHQGCGGTDVSPALTWRGVPAGARSLALTMIDQDVKPGKWSHWIVVNLPPQATGLQRDTRELPPPARGVRSGMGSDAYAGPCPPLGSGLHHYEITIWALPSAAPAIAGGAKATEVEALLRRVAIAHASVVATATR